ncbi:MAG: N-acetylmuramoyl-L-alanine amidase [Deltaproteobacteria bacterium]|nr:N-acetylmuramoyl-L-alanine amidase [Deltaproteobacteria bacterium]
MSRLTCIFAAALLLIAAPSHAFVVGRDGAPGGASAPFVVVIDPGHGGDDFGAVGKKGAAEKTINLGVALKVAEGLERHPGVSVLLTRSDDTFVPLRERAAFANAVGADVFISIHSNASVSRKAAGVETFFLSADATDGDAADIAAVENAVVTPAGTPEAQQTDDLKSILYDLTRTEANHESSTLAESVQVSLLHAAGKENRGVKQAPFAVLCGAVMPAALVEIGFISNPAEERRLSSKDEQARIAASIAEGVMGFKKQTVKGGRVVNETARKD